MNIAIITSGFLPVPATKGGAVENLIVNFMNENEKNNKTPYKITIFSEYDFQALEQAKNYKKTKVKFIKTPKLLCTMDKLIFLLAKNILKKENSQSYRFILKRLYYLNKVSKYLKKYNYDKVLLENHPTQFLALKWRKNYRKYKGKYYYHCHNEFSGLYGCERIIKETKKFICVSNYIAKKVQEYLKIESNKCAVLRNGINQNKFTQRLSQGEKEKLRRKYNIKKNDTVLLFTGRIVPEKGVLELLKALKYVQGNYKLLIVGSALNEIKEKTKYQVEIENIIKKDSKKISFTGYMKYDDIYQIYQLADIAVLPSIWEDPAPLTIIESLTCSLPIITTDSGGIPEYATSGSAIIIKRNTNLIRNMAIAIDNLIADKSKQKEMSKISIKVSKDLTIERYYNDFLKILK